MNAKIMTSTPVYMTDDGMTLTPYVNEDGEIWLASRGNGCGDDVMLQDIVGWNEDEIAAEYEDLDLAAMRADAEEIRDAGDSETADWLEDWIGRASAVCDPSTGSLCSRIGLRFGHMPVNPVLRWRRDEPDSVHVASGLVPGEDGEWETDWEGVEETLVGPYGRTAEIGDEEWGKLLGCTIFSPDAYPPFGSQFKECGVEEM